MGAREPRQGKQHTFLNEWQRNGLLARLPPSRLRVWGLRFLGRLTIHRPRTLLLLFQIFQLILGFWRRRQGYSRER